MIPALRTLCFVVLAGGLFGCASVAPWERANLAKKKMQMDPDGVAAQLEQHVFEYREGASGGYGSVGGGCGCN
jgi:hypothetical protein